MSHPLHTNPITEDWNQQLAVQHKKWFIGGERGIICYGCWHLYGIDVQWPCTEQPTLDMA